MRLKELTVKNFMSVGNQTQGLNFDQKHLTLVLGENLDQGGHDAGSRNGTGKTTMVNALSYALYGEALTKIRRDNLVNKTNGKNMLVTLTFEQKGVDYRIERGRKPGVMKWFVNEQEQELEDISQGDSRKTQEELNKMIGMSPEMFKHIVALNTYTQPFLSLHHTEQQKIIEQLLGITLLSEKAEVLKQKIKKSKEDIALENAKIEGIKISNEKVKETIQSLHSKSSAWESQKKEDIKKLERTITELVDVDIEEELESHKKLELWKKLTDTINQLLKDKSNYEASIVQADKQVQKLGNDLDSLHENAKCYACEQDLPHDKVEKMQRDLEEQFGDANSYVMDLAEKIKNIDDELKQLGEPEHKPQTFYDSIQQAYEHKQHLTTLETAVKNKKEESNPYDDQIKELESQAVQEVDWTVVNDLQKLKEHQEFLHKLLTNKDSFIRKKIIDQNLLFLNNRLTNYLDQLGLPHLVTFKNDLSVEITQLGQELDFDNLSRGERNRLILGLSFAFRDVWESLYQTINLLFIDELIDSGMDSAGVESSLAILKKMSRERGKNIFLISHRDELMGRVNRVLKVIKENGFTSYANDVDVMDAHG